MKNDLLKWLGIPKDLRMISLGIQDVSFYNLSESSILNFSGVFIVDLKESERNVEWW